MPPAETIFMDTSLARVSLADLEPITVRTVDHTPWEPVWDQLMRTYHYLGHNKMVGTRLKQIAFSGQPPLGLAGWRAAALKLEARDRFISWTPEQRKRFLPRVANGVKENEKNNWGCLGGSLYLYTHATHIEYSTLFAILENA